MATFGIPGLGGGVVLAAPSGGAPAKPADASATCVVAWHPGVTDATADRATASVCASLRVRGVAAKVGLAGAARDDYRVEVRRRQEGSYVFRIVHERDGIEISAARLELASANNVEEYAAALVQELLGPPRVARVLPAAPVTPVAPVTPITPDADTRPVELPTPKPAEAKPSAGETAKPEAIAPAAVPPAAVTAARKKPRALDATSGPRAARASASLSGEGDPPYGAGAPPADDVAPAPRPKAAKANERAVYKGTFFGGGVFYGGAANAPGSAGVGLDLALFYEGERFSVGPEYRYVSSDGSSPDYERSTSHQFHVIARGFFGPGELFYAGGGLGYVSLKGDSQTYGYSSSHRTSVDGSGIGIAGVFGIEALRHTKVRLLFELRLDLPLFSLEGYESSSYSGSSGSSSSSNVSKYAVPIAVSCLFLF